MKLILLFITIITVLNTAQAQITVGSLINTIADNAYEKSNSTKGALKNVPFTLDTFSSKHFTLVKKRINQEFSSKLSSKSSEVVSFQQHLLNVENQLDKLNDQIKTVESGFDDKKRNNARYKFDGDIQSSLTHLKKFQTYYDIKPLETEYTWYIERNEAIWQSNILAIEKKDSIKKAENETAFANEIESQRIKDSIETDKSMRYQMFIDEGLKLLRELYIKKYGTKLGTLIADGKVDIGMTTKMCEEALGEPDSMSKTSFKTGVIETWEYDNGVKLIFKNNKLVSFKK